MGNVLRSESPPRRRSSGTTRVFVSILEDFTHEGQSIDMSKPLTPQQREILLSRCAPPAREDDDRFIVQPRSTRASAQDRNTAERGVVQRRASDSKYYPTPGDINAQRPHRRASDPSSLALHVPS